MECSEREKMEDEKEIKSLVAGFRHGFDQALPIEVPVPFNMLLMIEHLRRAEEAIER